MSLSTAVASGVSSKRKLGSADNPIDVDDLDYDSGRGFSSPGSSTTNKRVKAQASTGTMLTPPASAESSSRRDKREESDSQAPLGRRDISDDFDGHSNPDSNMMIPDAIDAITNAHGEVDLNRVINSLNGMSRDAHMKELREDLQTKRDQLAEFKEYAEEREAGYIEAALTYDHQVRLYQDLKASGASRMTLKAERNNLRIVKLTLEQERDDFECVGEGYRAHLDLVAASLELKDIWTQLWDMYEAINKPGTSSSAAGIGSLFTECAYGYQLQVTITAARDKATIAKMVLTDALEYLELDEKEEA